MKMFIPRRSTLRRVVVYSLTILMILPLPLMQKVALATSGSTGDDDTPNCSVMCCENAPPGAPNSNDQPWCCGNWPEGCGGDPPGEPEPPYVPPEPGPDPDPTPDPDPRDPDPPIPPNPACPPGICCDLPPSIFAPAHAWYGNVATADGVHLRRGSFSSGSSDVVVPGPAFSWSYTRSYDSGSPLSSSGRNELWVSGANYPRLSALTGDEVDMLVTATSLRTFTGSAPTLSSPSDYDATMEKATVLDSDDLDNDSDTSEYLDVYTLTEHGSGRVLVFLGFSWSTETEYQGKLVERTNREYQAEGLRGHAMAYDSNGNVSVVTTAEPQSWRVDLSYTTAGGEQQIDEIEVHNGPLVSDTVIQKAEYTYYDELSANSDLGTDGDLVQVKLSRLASDGTNWTTRHTQYRYYTNSSSLGKAHQLKAMYAPDAVQRAIDAEAAVTSETDMLSESDSVVSDYASKVITYYTEDLDTDNSGYVSCETPWYPSGENLNSKYGGTEFDEFEDTANFGAVASVTTGGCASCGSSNTGAKHSYFYMQLNGGSGGPNDVIRIAVVDTEDGANPRVARYRQIWGVNEESVAIRSTFIEDPTVTTLNAWCRSKKFFTNLRISEDRMPSAHASAVDSDAELKKFLDPSTSTNDTDTVSSTSGVVYYYEYSGTYGDGNHNTGILVREGAGTGSRYYVSATDWGKGADDEPTNVILKKYTYPKQVTSRSDSSRITSATYSYDFWDSDDTAFKQIAITYPAIPTSQNGSGVATTTYRYYDEEGRLRWTKDGEGYVNYISYHPDFGGQALGIRDVNTSSLPSDVTGTGSGNWVAWSGGAGLTRAAGLPPALELTAKREYDDLGRSIKRIDEGGSEHYTRYEATKVMQFSYWTGGPSGSAELPVQVTEYDVGGTVHEQHAVKPSKSQWDSTNGLPKLTSYTSADYVARTVQNYDATSGRLESVDQFYDASSTSSYYRTRFLYDDLGRMGAKIQDVEASKYQVSTSLFDALGRTVETRKGVAISVPTDYGALDNSSPGTPSGFNGYATIGKSEYDSGGVGDSVVTSSKSYYGTGSSEYIESIPQRTFRGHVRGVLKKNGTTKFGPYSVSDIDWLGRTTAMATYASEPSWPTGYSDFVAYSSGGSTDQPKTSGHYKMSVTKYDDAGRVYRKLQYRGTEATKHFLANSYFDRRGKPVGSQQEHGLGSEVAYDGAGRSYQQRTVLTLESTKYSSGAFNYRAPQPDHRYGVGNESQMNGGDDSVVTISHSVLDDGSKVTESHILEAMHDDTDGIDLTADDDYVRSSSYSWYDDADRIAVSATHGSGNGSGSGAGSWQYTALPSSVTKPSTSSAAQLVTEYSYDSDSGRQETTTSPAGSQSRTFYDDLGRTTFTAANYTNFSPSSIAATIGGGTNDDEDQVVGFEYNGLGIRTQLTAYNASISTSDQVTKYKFDDDYSASLVTKEIYPDGDASSDNVQMTYHLDGSLDTKTDQRGVVFTYTYDTARRTTLQAATTIPAGVDNTVQSIGRSYDSLGRTEAVTSYAGTTTGSTVRNQVKYTHGSLGLVTSSQQDHSGAVGGSEPSVQYGYDDSSSSSVYNDSLRLETMTYPNGNVIYYGYAAANSLADRSGRVTEVRETNSSGQQIVEYEHMGSGRVANTEYPQPAIHQHADRAGDGSYEIWDRFGRVVQSYWRPTTGSGNNYLDRYNYGNDYAGNRTYRNQRVDMIAGALLDERDQAYSYDGLDRLVGTDQGTANNTTGAISTQKFEQAWKLDQLGNWEEFDQDDTGNGTWDLEQSRTHNDVNELTAIGLQSGGSGANWADPTFDAAGNMTTIPKPSSVSTSYTAEYDAWNRLVSLDSGSTASYDYDGLNRRIKRTAGGTTTHFYYNQRWQALEERSTESGAPTKQFVWGSAYVDELVRRQRDSDSNGTLDETLYAIYEAQYSITALLNTSGTIQERFTYTPYGVSTVHNANLTINASGTSYDWNHRYTSRELDPTSQLQLNRNRYYHQQTGRWISRDPIGYADGMSQYRYVKSNPLVWMDALGLLCQDPCAGFNPKAILGAHPKFGKLLDCAIKNGCISSGRFYCKSDCDSGQIAAYGYWENFSYYRNYIYICGNALNSPELGETLLEEAYHALTICARGSKREGTSLESLDHMMGLAGLTDEETACGKCIGREFLAKMCARGGAAGNWEIQINNAMSSCPSCSHYGSLPAHGFRNTNLGHVLGRWWQMRLPQEDCSRIDAACGF